jgi:isopentenyl phosphate kinase
MRNLIFIKLGGSLITKSTPYTPNLKIIRQIAKEIKKVKRKYEIRLLIGNGAGSFAHLSAKKFKTKEGYLEEKSKIGHCIVQDDASTLNRILVKELIKVGERAISVQPSSFLSTRNGKIHSFHLIPIKNYLKHDLVPVVFGDVISDIKKGCTILSTEEIFKFLAKKLNPSKIIFLSKVKGVLDEKGNVIPKIEKENFKKVKKFLKKADKVDVTGGMLHKVEKALEMARKNREIFILSFQKGNLEKCLTGKRTGTKIV